MSSSSSVADDVVAVVVLIIIAAADVVILSFQTVVLHKAPFRLKPGKAGRRRALQCGVHRRNVRLVADV